MYEEVPPELDRIGKTIVDSAFKVHLALGPGLLESVYRICLAIELEKRGLHVDREYPVEIQYENVKFPAAFRIDLLVERCVAIETKAAESFEQVHAAQLLTYLKLSNLQLGYLINFNVALLKDGLKRFARTKK